MMNVGMNEAVCGRKLNFSYFSCKDSGFFLEHRLFLSDIELGMLMSVWIITDFEEHNGINKQKKITFHDKFRFLPSSDWLRYVWTLYSLDVGIFVDTV